MAQFYPVRPRSRQPFGKAGPGNRTKGSGGDRLLDTNRSEQIEARAGRLASPLAEVGRLEIILEKPGLLCDGSDGRALTDHDNTKLRAPLPKTAMLVFPDYALKNGFRWTNRNELMVSTWLILRLSSKRFTMFADLFRKTIFPSTQTTIQFILGERRSPLISSPNGL